MKIEICGRDYDKLPIIEKLAWFIVYPFIAVLVGVMVLCFIFPLLIVFWIMMFVKLFEKRKGRRR